MSPAPSSASARRCGLQARRRGLRPSPQDRIGTFAERIAIDEADLALKPARSAWRRRRSLPLVALTAWQALVERGNVQPGQQVLIHAGAGGVGIDRDPARQAPRRAVATTVSGGNADFVRELGRTPSSTTAARTSNSS